MHCPEEASTGASGEDFGPRCGASTPAAGTHLERANRTIRLELSCNVFAGPSVGSLQEAVPRLRASHRASSWGIRQEDWGTPPWGTSASHGAHQDPPSPPKRLISHAGTRPEPWQPDCFRKSGLGARRCAGAARGFPREAAGLWSPRPAIDPRERPPAHRRVGSSRSGGPPRGLPEAGAAIGAAAGDMRDLAKARVVALVLGLSLTAPACSATLSAPMLLEGATAALGLTRGVRRGHDSFQEA